MKPKAKWSRSAAEPRVWTAAVGFSHLEVDGRTGTCEIAEWHPESARIGRPVWLYEQKEGVPVDAPDLMLMVEAELARRLTLAAETMDGHSLVEKVEAWAG